MKLLIRASLAPILLALLGTVDAAGIQQAFLVQNSGWMEPFYADPQSKLKPLVAAVAQSVTQKDDPVFLLAFNQSTAGNVSPKLLSQQKGAAALPLRQIDVARKQSGSALADTDFKEAVTKTITGPFASRPGIVWIFTNNKNSPGNDPATAERNRDFYRLVHLDPSITKAVVFPLSMPVQGKLYSARGLMVYALAYGEPAGAALDRILKEGRLSQVLTRPPARLKPLDVDGLRLVPENVKDMPDVRPSLAADQRTLLLDIDAKSVVPTFVLRASLENLFYPYVIQQAQVHAVLAHDGKSTEVQVSPATVSNLQPGERQVVEVRFQLPIEKVPSAWSAEALAAMGKRVAVPMSVSLSLSGQQLALSDDFQSQLRSEFPGDPISEIFAAPKSVATSNAVVPVVLRIQYPLLPVLLAILGPLALIAGALGAAFAFGRRARYQILVDQTRRHVMLKPFARVEIRDEHGAVIGTIARGMGKPTPSNVASGHTLAVL
jgi:hypothetical protein